MTKRGFLAFLAVLVCAVGVFYLTRNKRTSIEVRVERCEEDLAAAALAGTFADPDFVRVYGSYDCKTFERVIRERYARRPHWWQQPSRWSESQ